MKNKFEIDDEVKIRNRAFGDHDRLGTIISIDNSSDATIYQVLLVKTDKQHSRTVGMLSNHLIKVEANV